MPYSLRRLSPPQASSGALLAPGSASLRQQAAEEFSRQTRLFVDVAETAQLVPIVEERVTELVREITVVADLPHEAQELSIVGHRLLEIKGALCTWPLASRVNSPPKWECT